MMFVVRSKAGMIFTNTNWGERNGEELEYETRLEAEREMDNYIQSFPNQEFYIQELNSIGRPMIGVTRKVSITLPENIWEWFDEESGDNRSKFLREMILKSLGNEAEWDNYSALGYAILGAKNIGLNDEEIKKLVRSIYSEFDKVNVSEANKIYCNSDY